jgi:hypothetical protein
LLSFFTPTLTLPHQGGGNKSTFRMNTSYDFYENQGELPRRQPTG